MKKIRHAKLLFFLFIIFVYYTRPTHSAELVFLENNLKIVQEAVPTIKPVETVPSLDAWIKEYANMELAEGESLYAHPTAIPEATYTHNLQSITNISHQFLKKNPSFVEPALLLEKIIVQPGSTIYFWGDVHGDISTLVHFLGYLKNTEKIINDHWKLTEKSYIITGGDYTDRGLYGIEVTNTLAILKEQNQGKGTEPPHVILIRGNHESVSINEKYSFSNQFWESYRPSGVNVRKIKKEDKPWESKFKKILSDFYNTLPCVLYVGVPSKTGVTYLHFCHGGFDLYDVSKFLKTNENHSFNFITSIEASKFAKTLGIDGFQDFVETDAAKLNLPKEDFPQKYLYSQFLWSDFSELTDTFYTDNRGMIWGKNIIDKLLKYLRKQGTPIAAIFRGHQHNKTTMPGLFKQKNHDVYKLANSPVFTTVGSVGVKNFIRGRGLLKIEILSEKPTDWKVTNMYEDKDGSWKKGVSDTLTKWQSPANNEPLKKGDEEEEEE